ncbi:MAG: 3-oxoacyl-[acyl-carrier-protein] synthase III C-terminal domain-containing protein [Polyangiaceae bacterium]
MSHRPGIGVHAIGTFLPTEVRTNAWWSAQVVDGWRDAFERRVMSSEVRAPPSESERLAREAMAALEDDPFRGAVERRVLAEGATSSDMEIAAARDALGRADCAVDEIDLLVSSALVPDYLATNNACTIQEALGLPASCFVTSLDVAGNAFSQQLDIAQAMIESGRARLALLTQSAAHSLVLPKDDPHAPWFGDGATAVLVGPVRDGRGIVGRCHRSNGALQGSLVAGVPGGRWYDDAASMVYNASMDATQGLIRSLVDTATEAVGGALADAGVRADEIDFYACHQAFSWLRTVTQRRAGLSRARYVDTFAEAANVAAANVPLVLATAERDGLLGDGDLVATFTGGSGITFSSMIIRWGR